MKRSGSSEKNLLLHICKVIEFAPFNQNGAECAPFFLQLYESTKESQMSHMCKLDGKCSETKGMCIHEKMMMMVAVIVMLGAAGHFWLGLF
ncbi:MAG TPA: hypothetical protein VGK14_05910 [Novimethylophilus sp.]|jgi:hypothetical protein|uniref:hypothetical protein n=1 Tax=Novimethylophilus sp. TaxID=2137426 RepID=UPI002F420907